ncbi:hypothetical protein B0J13DRAFT_88665 [Dactylonectria estremocensis]|uniref:Uncharacterized protein n=1 Tax=Dactylonectria estremocensis TaxID=1079267 RepID=A0A9P9ITF2_9HYPO|nr:hypothetical protein B0J13DRAFT_88665 [Dactylonectria estremocensis]
MPEAPRYTGFLTPNSRTKTPPSKYTKNRPIFQSNRNRMALQTPQEMARHPGLDERRALKNRLQPWASDSASDQLGVLVGAAQPNGEPRFPPSYWSHDWIHPPAQPCSQPVLSDGHGSSASLVELRWRAGGWVPAIHGSRLLHLGRPCQAGTRLGRRLSGGRHLLRPDSEHHLPKPTLETIVQNFLPVFRYSFSPFLPRQENMTYSSTAIARKDRPMSLSITNEQDPVILATCPMSFVADVYAQKFVEPHFSGGNGDTDKLLIKPEQETSNGTKKWKQPLVAYHCNSTWAHKTTATFEFNGGFLDDTVLSLDLENEPALENITKSTELGIQATVVLDIKNKTIGDATNAAIVFGNRVASNGAELEGFETNNTTVLGLGLCLVLARWSPSLVTWDSLTRNIWTIYKARPRSRKLSR